MADEGRQRYVAPEPNAMYTLGHEKWKRAGPTPLSSTAGAVEVRDDKGNVPILCPRIQGQFGPPLDASFQDRSFWRVVSLASRRPYGATFSPWISDHQTVTCKKVALLVWKK